MKITKTVPVTIEVDENIPQLCSEQCDFYQASMGIHYPSQEPDYCDRYCKRVDGERKRLQQCLDEFGKE